MHAARSKALHGRRVEGPAATAVERGFVTQLDHAAYLGRELAKAETALRSAADYEQDAALGTLPNAEAAPEKAEPTSIAAAARESACGSNKCDCH